ncbi:MULTISPECIES: hypothetical protein [Vibrio]|uniref:Uncharacterized protein n=1 Tax=Vibrio parahaemolyticus TaxID=670 RepID=A0AA47LA80_VIBPH|nr:MULTISPECIES: hypothetical protein [Vibrio]MBE3780035.1 hypothetical protein [Vibrio parahaemolyticus]MBE4231417.1 hypothetical protein [Vibrio parahaemolyticus]MCZ6249621.1 hypothetical protein [Vibrio parahaemolyticus]MCZ6279364.1 hypothetical protein [Vibrio parahaemolyticus]MCZ6417381.1 hypothetical protein [Vibrio parahaemolyticus]
MIILITNVLDDVNENTHTVTFQIVDGSPSLNDVECLLTREINEFNHVTYCLEEKQGQFKTFGRQCVQGEHFSDTEQHELIA